MQRKLNKEQVEDILKGVKYKDWTLRVIEKHDDAILCQWIFYAEDNDTTKYGGSNPLNHDAELFPQHCRKWYVSCYSTDSEVIRTAHLAVQQAELHEINENFTYNNVRLFDPHIDLVELSKAGIKQDVRIEKETVIEEVVNKEPLSDEEKKVKQDFKLMLELHGRNVIEQYKFPIHFSPERIQRIKNETIQRMR